MSEKRRGLGKGLGALIPTTSEGRRPIDVFFPTPEQQSGAVAVVDVPDDAATAPQGPAPGGARDGAVDPVSGGAADNAAGMDARGAAAELAGDAGAGSGDTSKGGGTTAASVGASGGSLKAGQGVGEGSSDDGLMPVPGARFAELPVTSITPNPRQPRTEFDEGELAELVGSIREIGLLQPIVVRPAGDGYELIMGERRWRAAQEAGLGAIPAIVRDTEDGDLLRDALLENLHRSALNPLEEAAAYRQLLDDFECTHEQLAERISRSRPQISNTLRLLKLPPLVQRRIAAGVLSAGHARALLGLVDGAEIERLAQRIVAEGLSVRATEEIVALGGLAEKPKKAREPRAGQHSAAMDDLARRLSDRFDTRVRLSLGKTKGRLTVEFASVEDLNRILDHMAPQDSGVLKNHS